MKAAGLLLLLPAGLMPVGEAAEPPPRQLSEQISREIRSGLPTYSPLPAAPEPAAATPADPEVLVLPNLVVKEKRVPRIDPTDLLTPKELDRKFAREYEDSLHGLDAILNGFSIPFLSPSLAARGREIYEARKLEDLNHVVEAAKGADARLGSELNQAVIDMQRAEEWQNRPAGGK